MRERERGSFGKASLHKLQSIKLLGDWLPHHYVVSV
jgi:hypothetical protein